jgi:hypothetical protein
VDMQMKTLDLLHAINLYKEKASYTKRHCILHCLIYENLSYCRRCDWTENNLHPCWKFRLDKLPIL